VVHSASIIAVLGAEPTEGPSGEATPGGHSVENTGASEGQLGTAETKQADNPILPVWNELYWGLATFLLLWALMKFVLLKPIMRTMAERADKIRGDLAAAETAKSQAAGSLSEYEASLASARVEASRIIDEARAEADVERKRILAAAEAEVAELRSASNTEVTAAKAEALTSMRSQVATIAVQAAEAVVQKRLDAAAQRAIVDEYLNRASQN
jgi:F-type H+-transporting ATPase subunit b